MYGNSMYRRLEKQRRIWKPSMDVSLPHSVEQMLRRICTEHQQPPADARARRELASLGEESALELIRKISRLKIRNLSALICHMAKEAAQENCSKQCQRGRFIDSTNRNVMAASGLLNKNYNNSKQKGKLGPILSISMSVYIIVYPISNYLRKESDGRGPSAGVGNWQLVLMPTHWKQLSSSSISLSNTSKAKGVFYLTC